MMKSNLPPPRVRPQFKIQEIKLFDGYEGVATSSPVVLRRKKPPPPKKQVKRATIPEIVVYFGCIFVVALIITAIIAAHFQH